MRVFCPTCRTMREVMDSYFTSDRRGEELYAQPLECGHDGGDGGGRPSRRIMRSDPRLVARVVELQEGAKKHGD